MDIQYFIYLISTDEDVLFLFFFFLQKIKINKKWEIKKR